MAKRTVKLGAIRSKQLRSKGSTKGSSVWAFRKFRRLDLRTAIDDGVIESVTNPIGNASYWFRKRRKLNWDTRQRFDKDGYDRWGNKHPRAGKWLSKHHI